MNPTIAANMETSSLIVKKIRVGLDSRQEANDVADHQNDIGKDTHDRKVVFAGYEHQDKPTDDWLRPLIFIAIATTEQSMKEIEDEFMEEVPILFEMADGLSNAPEFTTATSGSLKCK